MTLIAGFRSFGTPVLIGDFLITTDNKMSGHKKKLLLISKNFALAWTGDELAANSVVKTLQSSLENVEINLESIEKILIHPSTSDLGKLNVTLVCWVVDSLGEHCFRWNSDYPSELFLGESLLDGSGESYMKTLVGPKGLIEEPPVSVSSPRKVVFGALSVVTKMMGHELIGPSTEQFGFGFGYELVRLVNGRKFEYVDNILYICIMHEFNDIGFHQRSYIKGKLYKYKANKSYSVIYSYDKNNKSIGVNIINPIGGNQVKDINLEYKKILGENFSFPFKSSYYCIFELYKTSSYTSNPLITIVSEKDKQKDFLFTALFLCGEHSRTNKYV